MKNYHCVDLPKECLCVANCGVENVIINGYEDERELRLRYFLMVALRGPSTCFESLRVLAISRQSLSIETVELLSVECLPRVVNLKEFRMTDHSINGKERYWVQLNLWGKIFSSLLRLKAIESLYIDVHMLNEERFKQLYQLLFIDDKEA